MSVQCVIGKVDRQGNGEYILCWEYGYPAAAGSILLRAYNEEADAARLIAGGHIHHLDAGPGDGRDFVPDGIPPVFGRGDPNPFEGGTEEFFSRFRAMWAYCWTPDGWLAAKNCVLDYEGVPFYRPQPLSGLVDRRVGSDGGCNCTLSTSDPPPCPYYTAHGDELPGMASPRYAGPLRP